MNKIIKLASPPILFAALAACNGNVALTGDYATNYQGAVPVVENQVTAAPDAEPYDKELYLSYDESSSTASAELAKYQLSRNQVPSASLGKAYEFLSLENFSNIDTENLGTFDVSWSVWPTQFSRGDDDVVTIYQVGAYVKAPELDKAERKNVVLTLVVDVSGSMSNGLLLPNEQAYSRMDLTNSALLTMVGHSLKAGDIVNIVTFESNSRVVVENFAYTDDNANDLRGIISNISAGGGTNLDAGLSKGYELAQRYYNSEYANRVVMITDAQANIGQVNADVIAQNLVINDLEGIHFSGVGVSTQVNFNFLEALAEQGKGSYQLLATFGDAQRVMKDQFIAMVDIAAKNVKFKLTYPSELSYGGGAAEQASSNQDEVQSSHFFYNSDQFFNESFFLSGDEQSLNEKNLSLSILYQGEEGMIEESISDNWAELVAADNTAVIESSLVRAVADVIAVPSRCSQARELESKSLTVQTELAQEYRGYLAFLCASY